MTKRILIADDDPDILTMLESRLKANRYEVTAVNNGKAALDKIRQERPDLVILDVVMPAPNGFQVCRTVKDDAELKKTPVILLTAKATQSDKFWGTESGADAYVTKPYHPEDLLKHVHDLLGG